MITSVPTMLALVMRETEELAKADLSCVTTAVTGSAPSTAEFFEQMHRLFPKAETANSWGTTEVGPDRLRPASRRHGQAAGRARLSSARASS